MRRGTGSGVPHVDDERRLIRRRAAATEGVSRWVIGGLGVTAATAGVAVLFATEHEARGAFLLTLGLVLMLVAWFWGRVELEGFELLGAKARERDVVKTRLELAKASDNEQLHRQAAVLQELVGLYGLYEHVRHVERAIPRRIAVLDQVAARMRAPGAQAEFDPVDVIRWYHDGTDPLPVIALNLMLANEEYRDFLAVLETIDAPHSLFEQYLRAAARRRDAVGPRSAAAAPAGGRDRPRAAQAALRRDEPLMGVSHNLLDRLGQAS